MREKKTNYKEAVRPRLKLIIAAVAVAVVPLFGSVSFAATTCKSKVEYPANTTAKVNVRAKAGTDYTSYGTVAGGTKVTILGSCKNKDQLWYKVRLKINDKTKTGYIFSGYVKKCTNVKGTVDIKDGSYLNMREKSNANSAVVAKLDKKTAVTVTNFTGAWYKIKIKDGATTKKGFASASYIKVSREKAGNASGNDTTPAKTDETPAYVNDKVSSGLNVRYEANTKSTVLLVIPKGTAVTVLKTEGDWYKIKVTYNGKTVTGYASKTYITLGKNGNDNGNTKPEKPGDTNTTTTDGYVNDSVTSYLNVRESASTSAAILLKIPAKTAVKIKATSGDWYKIKVTYNGKTVTGYVAKQYITVGTVKPEDPKTEEPKPEEPTTEEPKKDEKFETLIKKFPESYRSSLRALHGSYPKWKFVAVDTGLDWAEAVRNESVVGRNVITSNYPRGYSSFAPFSYLSTAPGAYNWSTDSYVVKDGNNWYSADTRVIAYYMDARNFLNENDIFQFEALAYDTSQKASVVQSILNNTFMSGNYDVVDIATNERVTGSYKKAFMDAGTKAMASPYFLSVRCKQEVGVNGSASTSGNYPGYKGIYNYYNIGAFDGGDAVAKGLSWASTGTAYGKPWTTPYKSIVGGAQYIAANYISVGQNTLYLQKFNVNPTNKKNLYVHQYMTNVQAPYSEGRSTRSAYNSLGILSGEMVFYIPVYSNMPESACRLPEAAGNPNPYLSSISVTSGGKELALTPTFSLPSSSGVLDNDTYTMVVESDVKSVTVSAKAISKYASVSGTGSFELGESGTTTTIKVTGKAQNGTKQVYKIKITRK